MPDLPRANRTATRLKNLLQEIRADVQAGPIERGRLLELMGDVTDLINPRSLISEMISDPVEGARFSRIQTKAETVRDWLFNNMPKHADGSWRVYAYDLWGKPVDIPITPAQLSTLIDQFNDLMSEL